MSKVTRVFYRNICIHVDLFSVVVVKQKKARTICNLAMKATGANWKIIPLYQKELVEDKNSSRLCLSKVEVLTFLFLFFCLIRDVITS